MSWFMLFVGVWALCWSQVWTSKDIINILIKISYFVISLTAFFFAAKLFGYVVQL